jgi:endonuclease YncB( thermonuclease family)
MFKKLTYSIAIICLSSTFSFSQNSTAKQQPAVQKTAPPVSSINANSNVNLIEGKVVYIYDGDTISVQTPDKLIYFVRLQGIDAPESKQNYGKKAKKKLEDLIEGKDVKVVIHKKDLYDRFISSVYLNGQDVSLMQIAAGMAWHYKQYSSDQTPETRKRYAQAEQRARDEKIGLWEDDKPTPPWDHKNGKTKDNDKAEKIVNASANSTPAQPTNKAGKASKTNTAPVAATPSPEKAPAAASNQPPTATPKQTTDAADAKTTDASDKKYVRGPRGGCYYINKSGGKTYVDRNLCQE